MIKGLAVLTTALSMLASATAQCNGTQYLQVTLWDSFGDGWEDAYWMLRDPAGDIIQDQSTCWEIEKVREVYPCDHDPAGGFYYMIVQTPDEALPEAWWEIVWKVEVFFPNGTSTGQYYEGVYNTTMVWEYDETNDVWTLTHYDGVPDFTCDGCTGGACKPKPHPKKDDKKKDKKDDKKNGPIKGDGKGSKGDTGSDTVTVDTSSTNSSSSDDGPKYGPRAVDLTVKMSSEDCTGWGDVNYIGAHWYIADTTLTRLFDDGSLCEADACEGSCNICLGDGSYIFRVTGPTFNETLEDQWWKAVNGSDADGDHSVLDVFRYQSWEFCHARGSYNDQLNFHVKKGKCIPDDLRWADEICDSLENSTVTLYGVVALGGVTSEMFSASDANVVLSVLAETVQGWSVSRMAVLSTSLDARALAPNHRALNSYTHDVQFSVAFTAEDYGIDGATFANVENLVNDMAATIKASFSSGAFPAQLAGVASLAGVSLLGEVNSGELLSLEINKISYAHNHLVYYYGEEESSTASVTSSSSGSVSAFVYGAAAIVCVVALVAVVGVATHNFNGYKKVSNDSVHESESAGIVELEEVVNPFSNSEQGQGAKFVFPTRRV